MHFFLCTSPADRNKQYHEGYAYQKKKFKWPKTHEKMLTISSNKGNAN
jgi:hypothetical protein